MVFCSLSSNLELLNANGKWEGLADKLLNVIAFVFRDINKHICICIYVYRNN